MKRPEAVWGGMKSKSGAAQQQMQQQQMQEQQMREQQMQQQQIKQQEMAQKHTDDRNSGWLDVAFVEK